MKPIDNFVEQLFIRSINFMKTNNWEWPDAWDTKRQLEFLDDSLQYAEQNELYEQCAIIRDVKETIK
jgi:protein-arginine kinase activator protein McsA